MKSHTALAFKQHILPLTDILTIQRSAGGMYIVGGNGKIEINNTFEERLKICETDALPSVRTTLFGKNENRRFFD